MKHLKTYKFFESLNNIEFIHDLCDIFSDLGDKDLVMKRLFNKMAWYEFYIKSDDIVVKINSNREVIIDDKEDWFNLSCISRFYFNIKVDSDNLKEIIDASLRAFEYMKNNKDWDFEINLRFFVKMSEILKGELNRKELNLINYIKDKDIEESDIITELEFLNGDNELKEVTIDIKRK